MDTNLFKVSKISWAVTSNKDAEARVFGSIEDASTYLMESVGIPDEQIDIALIDMASNGTARANFGDAKGHFLFSDSKRLDEVFGNA